MLRSLKTWARRIKNELWALSLAAQDARTPWYAKVLAALVLGYALSPVDLIPDFIPVLGLLDDALLVPLGILLALRLIPSEVMTEARDQVAQGGAGKQSVSVTGAVVIVTVWAVLLSWLGTLLWRLWAR